MKLTQLLSINGELQSPLTESESPVPPTIVGNFPKSGRGILARWDLGKREATGRGKLPYALITLDETRFATAPFSTSHKANAFAETATPGKLEAIEKENCWPARLRRLALWLLIALLALSTIACGFGVQEIRFTREKYRLGQQLRAAEEKRKSAELACRQMHACLVVYAARENRAKQEQNPTRPVAYTRPKPKPNTTS